MSGFAVHLDFAAPAAPERVSAMAEAIAYRGPHRRATRATGPCTLTHAALWTTPESEHEDQPQRHITRDFWLAADARVDNRDELVAQLRGCTRHPLHTDADLILAAYERWGADLLDNVIGDVAFALWDGEREELLAVRDIIGGRPVFYAHTPNGVVAASTLPAVLAGFDRRPTVDEEFLAAFLAVRPSRTRTFWSGVERLAPGHLLRVGRERTSVVRYWYPDIEPVKMTIGEAAEQVRTIFDEAVRCRLRTRDGIVADVSGGFDSSTTVSTAVGLGSDIRGITLAYRRNREADETLYSHVVAQHLAIPLDAIEADEIEVLDPVADIRRHREPLYAVDASSTAAVYDVATSHGRSVSLSGVGGDELFHCTDLGIVDQAGRGRLIMAWRWASLRGYDPASAIAWLGRSLVRDSARSALIRAARLDVSGTAAEMISRRRVRRVDGSRPWLNVVPPLDPPQPTLRAGSRAATARRAYFTEASFLPPAVELTERLAAERGVETRAPFLDRRLIELLLQIPEPLVRWQGQRRGLHRLAFGTRLPAQVRERQDKGDLSRPYVRNLLASIDRARAAEAIAALGGRVDQEMLLATYDSGYDAFELSDSRPGGFDLWASISAGLAVQTLGTAPERKL